MKRADLEQAVVGLHALDLRRDLDRLLEITHAGLRLEWKGKWITLQVTRDEHVWPIARWSKATGLQGVAAVGRAADVRGRFNGLLPLHGAVLALGIDKEHGERLAKFQFHFPEVPGRLGLTIMACHQGRAVRYKTAAQEAAQP